VGTRRAHRDEAIVVADDPEAERFDPLLAGGLRRVLGRSADLELGRRLEEDARVHEPHERQRSDADRVENGTPSEEAEEVTPRRRNAPDVAFRIGAVVALGRRHGTSPFARVLRGF
jgi:hypothetical protein